jgi:uncharacterized protein (TIGR02757 family)
VNRLVRIKEVLENLYDRYNHRSCIKPDPLQFVYRYSSRADMEIAALLAAVLAYGRVEQIEKDLFGLFALMGDSPFEFVSSFNQSSRRKLRNFRHRFTTGDDISDLLELLKRVLREKTSLEDFFLAGYSRNDKNIILALSRFCESLLQMYTRTHKRPASRGLRYLLAGPAGGSACKRLNLFLRWMVRKDSVDTGLWNRIDKAKLVVPVDVHMGRLCRLLGFYDHKTASLAAALKITESFAVLEPADPVKYDFALSRIGIVQDCTGGLRPACEDCRLYQFCLKTEAQS